MTKTLACVIATFLGGGSQAALASDFTGESPIELVQFIPSGRQPEAIECGDLNGDGIDDIVCVNHYLDEIWVILLDAAGEVISSRAFDSEGSGNRLALADFDADGDLDAAVANKFGQQLVVRWNDGTGGFESWASYDTVRGPHDIIAADLNDDGVPDLAGASEETGIVAVLLGQPGGMPDMAHIVTTQLPALWLRVGDITGDGVPDLISPRQSSLEFRAGLGDGTFAAPTVHALSGTLLTADVADLDSDGDLDLAVLSEEDGVYTVRIVMNSGSGVFVDHPSIEMGYWEHAMDMKIGDVFGDALPDVVISHVGRTDKVCVFENRGGEYALAQCFATHGRYPIDIELHDVNQDGLRDILTANGISDSISVLRNDEKRRLVSTRLVGSHSDVSQLQTADIDNDGDHDLLARGGLDERIVIGMNDGAGIFSELVDIDSGLGVGTVEILPVDLLGRGTPDLIVIKRASHRMSVIAGDGHGNFLPFDSIPIGLHAHKARAGDVDGDGDEDIIVGFDDQYRGPDLYLNNGFFSLELAGEIQTFRTFTPEDLLDVDFDGDLDLIGIELGNIRIYVNDGTGDFSAGEVIELDSVCNTYGRGDINGDGLSDFMLGSYADDTIHIILSGSGQLFDEIRTIEGIRNPNSFVVSDVDQDGDQDICFDAQGYGFNILINPGDHQFSNEMAYDHPLLAGLNGLAVADWDGNDFPDFAQSHREEIFIVSNTCPNAQACAPDLTSDGVLNFFDISAFLQAFNGSDPVADFDGNGIFNFFDLSAFLQAFNGGCP